MGAEAGKGDEMSDFKRKSFIRPLSKEKQEEALRRLRKVTDLLKGKENNCHGEKLIVVLSKEREELHKKLLKHNILLIKKIVFSLLPLGEEAGLSHEDMLQLGKIGFSNSIESYDCDKGYGVGAFCGYIRKGIVQKIFTEIARNYPRTIKRKKSSEGVSFSCLIKIRELRAISGDFFKEKGVWPNVTEICEIVNKLKAGGKALRLIGKREEIILYLEVSSALASDIPYMDIDESDDEEGIFSPLPNSWLFATDTREGLDDDQIEYLLSGLKESHRQILMFSYGLCGEKPLNLRQISKKTGYTKEDARQKIQRAEKHLKKRIDVKVILYKIVMPATEGIETDKEILKEMCDWRVEEGVCRMVLQTLEEKHFSSQELEILVLRLGFFGREPLGIKQIREKTCFPDQLIKNIRQRVYDKLKREKIPLYEFV